MHVPAGGWVERVGRPGEDVPRHRFHVSRDCLAIQAPAAALVAVDRPYSATACPVCVVAHAGGGAGLVGRGA